MLVDRAIERFQILQAIGPPPAFLESQEGGTMARIQGQPTLELGALRPRGVRLEADEPFGGLVFDLSRRDHAHLKTLLAIVFRHYG